MSSRRDFVRTASGSVAAAVATFHPHGLARVAEAAAAVAGRQDPWPARPGPTTG